MDVIIFAGQSNMQGEAESRPIIKSVKNAYEYYHKNKKLINLNHPVGEYVYGEKGTFLLGQATEKNGCLVPAFCKEYLKHVKTDGVVAVSTACGNTTISEWQENTERFKVATDKMISAIELVKSQGKLGRIYLVWLQGESDSFRLTSSEDYLQKLTAFKNAVKKIVPIEKFCIIKVGYFASNCSWCVRTVSNILNQPVDQEQLKKFDEQIMFAQEKAVETDSDFIMLSRNCPEFSLDKKRMNPFVEGHYNAKTLDLIGKINGRALGKYANGV